MATRLQILRLARGESLREVMERLGGKSRSLAYQVEQGRRKAPEGWRPVWAAALGIDPGKLFDADGYPLQS